MEKVVGATKRINRIASDIVDHFEARTSELEGKAMIVCMSRRICVDLHNEIMKLRPEWYHKDDEKGLMKVVMMGSASEPTEWQEHIRNRARRRKIGDEFKDLTHGFKIIFVRDMFLTGFDTHNLYTMYLDKPLKGHPLMMAIAPLNVRFAG